LALINLKMKNTIFNMTFYAKLSIKQKQDRTRVRTNKFKLKVNVLKKKPSVIFSIVKL